MARRSRPSGPVAILAVVALASVTMLPGAVPSAPDRRAAAHLTAAHGKTQPLTSGTLATPPAADVTQGCQLLSPAKELGPTTSVPANPVSMLISPSGGVWGLTASAGAIYVVNGSGLSVFSGSGSLEHHFSLPASIVSATSGGHPVDANGVSQPVVDPSGDVYVSSYYGRAVVEIGTSGNVVRTFDPGGGNPTNIFALHSPSGAWELGVTTTQHRGSSYVYNGSGGVTGAVELQAAQGAYLSVEPDHDILYAAGNGFVQTWSPSAQKVLSEFGSSEIHGDGTHTGGPLAFYYPDEAVGTSGGEIYAADGLSTMTVTKPTGLLVGTTTLGGQTDFDGDVAVFGNEIVAQTGQPFDNGAGTVSLIPMATISDYLNAHQAASNLLGWGAGLHTGVLGNYFPSGKPPTVSAGFAPWWQKQASHLELSYQVWDSSAITNGQTPAATTIHLPDTADALANVALTLGQLDPGPYEVEARLLDTSTSPPSQVGATCMPFALGAPGDRLNLNSLPAGLGSGGPQDPRGVALNAQLGLDGLRSLNLISWSSLLPDCNAGAPSAATCGSGALRISTAPQIPFHAAALADKDHVRYWIQISGGDPVSLALVDSGYWKEDIRAIVAHYSHVPSGCSQCAPVTGWEPWNEANNTGWGNPQQYVTKVLRPFYTAVEAAQPGATVLGGSSLEVDLGWWTGLIAAGGLKYMTVASVHPYPGSDDSWEEDGIELQLEHLKAALGHTPLWLSEIGWWSDGGYDFTEQANNTARSLIWQRLIGIPVWNYFFDEGAFGNDGISFSLIQAADGADTDDYVKPAALAIMEANHQTGGRGVMGQVPSGVPQTWDARFGPAANGTTDTAAVWSDGLVSTEALSAAGNTAVPVTVTTQYGATTTLTLKPGTHYALPVSDQVVYVDYPHQDKIRIAPPESYGSDVALGSAGATATATSAQAVGGPSAALVNPTYAADYGQGWYSATTDTRPSLTVTLKQAAALNRIIIDTQSSGSVAPGLRSYTVEIETTSGTWQQVASVTAQFRHHSQLVDFAPIEAEAVRIDVSVVDMGGYYGGGLPFFCTLSGCPAYAFLHAVEVYAGTDSPKEIGGAGLKPL